MNHLAKAFIVYLCVASISCEFFARGADKKSTNDIQTRSEQKSVERTKLIAKLQSMMKATPTNETTIALPASTKNETASSRQKRQLPLAYAGGFGLGYGQYDYNDYYGDYANDYNYDYYDWVCSDTSCQLCDILTSECCNPNIDINCFLPDSCLNNPCLGGGTCITTRTVDLRPDFICVCLPGLTGKYCQLANDYFVGGNIIDPIMMAGLPPVGRPIGGGMGGPGGPGGPGGYGGYGDQQQGPIGGGYGGQQQGPIGGGPMGGAGGYGAQQQGPIGGGYGGQQQGPIGGGYGGQQQAPIEQQMPVQQPAYGQQAPIQQQQPAYGQQAPAPQPEQYQPNLSPQQPAYAAQPSYAQDIPAPANNGGQYGVRTMSAKRPKCADGQLYNYAKNSCAEFTLKRKVAA